MKQKTEVNRRILLVLLFSILVCVMVGSYLYRETVNHDDIDLEDLEGEEIELDSYGCTGDIEQPITPCSYVVDGDCSTRLEWNTTSCGDFTVHVIENFTVPSSVNSLKWGFKAYHRADSLMPTPMEISYWNGSKWKQLYVLDDQEHRNEVFVETLDLPTEAFSDGRISIKTRISYSSHVTGVGSAQQLWHYVEYFEGILLKQ